MADPTKPVKVELGIEFVVELLLFLYPYGADQMNLPHNFWLGLGCWGVGTAIAIRMFWIFPIWRTRLSSLEKALIAFILVCFFIFAFYKPVVSAYRKRDDDMRAKTIQAQAVSQQKLSASQSNSTPITTPSVPPTKQATHPEPKAQQDNSVHVARGAKIEQRSIGDCSPNIVGGANTLNCGSPALKLEYSVGTPLPGGGQPIFSSLDRTKCPVVTYLRIVPNQPVPPPITVALDFDHPITQISIAIEGIGMFEGGGPSTVGIHAVSSTITSPGIGPRHPLIVEVCSEVPVRLAGEPRLLN